MIPAYFDEAAIKALLRGPVGPVARDLEKRARRVRNAAVRFCAVDTGRLRSSITHKLGEDAAGLVAVIGTDVAYAAYVEFGTSKMKAQPFLRPALELAGDGKASAAEIAATVKYVARERELTKIFSGKQATRNSRGNREKRAAAAFGKAFGGLDL